MNMHGDWRARVGPIKKFDIMAAHQFNVMTSAGRLREHHTLADVGCGCLRGGRLFIPYLGMGNYFGVEPDKELLTDGVMHEAGPGMVSLKAARFSNRSDFDIVDEWPQIEWDRILAQSILTHTGPALLDAFMARMEEAVNEHTEIFITFLDGPDATSAKTGQVVADDEWLYPYCVTYTGPTIRAAARRHGLDMDRLRIQHPNNHTWVKLSPL